MHKYRKIHFFSKNVNIKCNPNAVSFLFFCTRTSACDVKQELQELPTEVPTLVLRQTASMESFLLYIWRVRSRPKRWRRKIGPLAFPPPSLSLFALSQDMTNERPSIFLARDENNFTVWARGRPGIRRGRERLRERERRREPIIAQPIKRTDGRNSEPTDFKLCLGRTRQREEEMKEEKKGKLSEEQTRKKSQAALGKIFLRFSPLNARSLGMHE